MYLTDNFPGIWGHKVVFLFEMYNVEETNLYNDWTMKAVLVEVLSFVYGFLVSNYDQLHQ